MTNFEKIKNMSVEERTDYFYRSLNKDENDLIDEWFDDVSKASQSPRICKVFAGFECSSIHTDPDKWVCESCAYNWLQSETD